MYIKEYIIIRKKLKIKENFLKEDYIKSYVSYDLV